MKSFILLVLALVFFSLPYLLKEIAKIKKNDLQNLATESIKRKEILELYMVQVTTPKFQVGQRSVGFLS